MTHRDKKTVGHRKPFCKTCVVKQDAQIKFMEIAQGGFFYYQGHKLCKFGKYGMGVGVSGKVAKEIGEDELVIKTTL